MPNICGATLGHVTTTHNKSKNRMSLKGWNVKKEIKTCISGKRAVQQVRKSEHELILFWPKIDTISDSTHKYKNLKLK